MRRICSTAIALALLPLLSLSPPAYAQSPQKGMTLSPAEIARREALKQIETNRAAYVSALLEKWNTAALAKGFHPHWKIEAFPTLMALSAEQLLAANAAQSFEKFRVLVTIGVPFLGSLAADLVYTPVTPCRVLDTRFASGSLHGPIAGGSSISFQVNDSFGAIPSQGGNPAGCPLMPISGEPSAVAVTLTAVPSATGDLRAFAFSGPVPVASVLNYTPGIAIANTTIVPACQGCGPDLTVQVDVGATQIIADVVGYFRPPVATPTDVLVQNAMVFVNNGDQFDIFTPSCPAGWRVTGGGFLGDLYTARIFVSNRPAVQGDFSASGAVGINLADSWLCQGQNNSGSGTDVWCYVLCSRVPGL
jgi:hypothetical protein